MSEIPAWMKRVHVAQGFPKPSTDTAPTAVFLVLFLMGAVGNFAIFFRNKKMGKLFVFNGMCGGFCMSRIVTCSLRLAFIYNVTNENLALASTIFTAAGVLLLFIVNIIFSQRMLRGLHPHLGWQRWIHWVFVAIYAMLFGFFVLVVVGSIQLFLSTNKSQLLIDVKLQKASSVYLFFVALIPIPLTLFALIKPNKKSEVDHFGTGSFGLKALPLLASATLLSAGAGFRTCTLYAGWKPEYNTPGMAPWWNAKWCLYFFQFGVEMITIVIYLASRKDKLFYIPNGSKGPGSYSRVAAENEEKRLAGSETHSVSETTSDVEKTEIKTV